MNPLQMALASRPRRPMAAQPKSAPMQAAQSMFGGDGLVTDYRPDADVRYSTPTKQPAPGADGSILVTDYRPDATVRYGQPPASAPQRPLSPLEQRVDRHFPGLAARLAGRRAGAPAPMRPAARQPGIAAEEQWAERQEASAFPELAFHGPRGAKFYNRPGRTHWRP
jgi:hypothetical protein